MPDVSTTYAPQIPLSPLPSVALPKSASENKPIETDSLKPSEAELHKPADPDTLKDHVSPQVAASPPIPGPQPASEPSTSTIAPSVVPPMPQTAAVDLQRDAASTLPTVRSRSKNRPGRPPNINENSLMRRLECIMAVETSRMTMAEACTHYDISPRTFYRWLRSKDRLIQLTGFTAEDFKNGPPPPERTALSDQIHRMPPVNVADLRSNPPRISQPAIAAQAAAAAVARQPAPIAHKRRLPRVPLYSNVCDDRGLRQSQMYHRNTTKMPSRTSAAADEQLSRLGNSTGLTRNKRPSMFSPSNEMDVRDVNHMYHFSDPDEAPTTPNMGKRRRISRGDTVVLEETVEDDFEASVHPSRQFLSKGSAQVGANINGNVSHEQLLRQSSPEGTQTKVNLYPEALPAAASGIHEGFSRGMDLPQTHTSTQFIECSQKHKIEVVMGSKKVNLAWYHGATSADIKEVIMRRFSLVSGTQWALVDKHHDEIIISDGIPNGRYHITVLP